MIIQYDIDFFKKLLFSEVNYSFELDDNTLTRIEELLSNVKETDIITQNKQSYRNVYHSNNNSHNNHNNNYKNHNNNYKNGNRYDREKDRHINNNYRNKQRNKMPYSQNQVITDDEWETIRTFKKTEIQKLEGIELLLGNIRKYINKLTDKNFDEISLHVLDELKQIKEHKDYEYVSEIIFNIASQNSFYSLLYAKLYKNIIDAYPNIKDVLIYNIENTNKTLDNIIYIDPDTDYDGFCEYNKQNEQRRALFLFYINLLHLNIIQPDIIISLIVYIQQLISNRINDINSNINITEELSELLYILIVKSIHNTDDSASILEKNDKWSSILENVQFISNAKHKEFPNLNKKIIFKHMDILEEL